jgi:hypothetical protein
MAGGRTHSGECRARPVSLALHRARIASQSHVTRAIDAGGTEVDVNQAAGQGDPWRGLPPWPGERPTGGTADDDRSTLTLDGSTPRRPAWTDQAWDDEILPAADATGSDPHEPAVPGDPSLAAPITGGAPTDGDAVPETEAQAAFRAELAEAMRTVARAQLARIIEEAERLEAESVSAARSRGATAADEMRAAADQAASEIESWMAAEIARVQQERERRLDAARRDADRRLEWHASRVDKEVERIEESGRAYRAEVESFFARLDAEHDPRAMAGLAAQMPAPPRFDQPGAILAAVAALPERPAAETGAEEVVLDASDAADAVDWAADPEGPAAGDAPAAAEAPVADDAPAAAETGASEELHPDSGEQSERAASWSPGLVEPDGEGLAPATPALAGQRDDSVEPAGSVEKDEPTAAPISAADHIRERLRFIAERRLALAEVSDRDRTGEPAHAAGS